jgi:hypothetical protein
MLRATLWTTAGVAVFAAGVLYYRRVAQKAGQCGGAAGGSGASDSAGSATQCACPPPSEKPTRALVSTVVQLDRSHVQFLEQTCKLFPSSKSTNHALRVLVRFSTSKDANLVRSATSVPL